MKNSFPLVGASILDSNHKLETIANLLNINIKWIHYDVMDGDFVSKFSLPIEEVKMLIAKSPSHIVDIHLMVSDVKNHLEQFADIADYITFHYEALMTCELEEIVKKFQNLKLGIAINPQTPLSAIKHYLPFLNHVLIMSVEAGLGGQKFINSTIEKITNLKQIIEYENLSCLVFVDGGINDQTGPLAIKNGADVIVCGSYLLNNLDEKTVLKVLGNEDYLLSNQ